MTLLILLLIVAVGTTLVQVAIAVKRRLYQGKHRIDSRLVERVPWPST